MFGFFCLELHSKTLGEGGAVKLRWGGVEHHNSDIRLKYIRKHRLIHGRR